MPRYRTVTPSSRAASRGIRGFRNMKSVFADPQWPEVRSVKSHVGALLIQTKESEQCKVTGSDEARLAKDY